MCTFVCLTKRQIVIKQSNRLRKSLNRELIKKNGISYPISGFEIAPLCLYIALRLSSARCRLWWLEPKIFTKICAHHLSTANNNSSGNHAG